MDLEALDAALIRIAHRTQIFSTSVPITDYRVFSSCQYTYPGGSWAVMYPAGVTADSRHT